MFITMTHQKAISITIKTKNTTLFEQNNTAILRLIMYSRCLLQLEYAHVYKVDKNNDNVW